MVISDESIERMLLDIFQCWFKRETLYKLISNNKDAESVLERQEIFNQAKDIVKRYVCVEEYNQGNLRFDVEG